MTSAIPAAVWADT